MTGHLLVPLPPSLSCSSVPACPCVPLSVPLQLLAGHLVFPCGALRNVVCLLQQRALTHLDFIFCFALLLAMDTRLCLSSRIAYIFPHGKSWFESALGLYMLDGWWGRIRSCQFTKLNFYLYSSCEVWVKIIGTNQEKKKKALAPVLVEQIITSPSLSSCHLGWLYCVADLDLHPLHFGDQSGGCFCSHFADEELKAPKGEVACPRPHRANQVESLGFRPDLPGCGACGTV